MKRLWLRHLISPGFNRNSRARMKVSRHFLFSEPHTTLDVGCGDSGYWSITSAHRGGKVFAIDTNHESIHRLQKTVEDLGLSGRIEAQCLNLFELPLKKKYDQIICMEVLEHIRDDKSAIRWFAERLEINGFMHITTPNIEKDAWWEEPLEWHKNGGHVRHGYSFETMKKLLNDVGLEVVARYRIGVWGTSTAYGMDVLFGTLLQKLNIPTSIRGVICFLLFTPLEWLGNSLIFNDPGMSIYVIASHQIQTNKLPLCLVSCE